MALSLPPPTTYGTNGHKVAGESPGAIQMFLVITSLTQKSLKLKFDVILTVHRR
jgi:hypothetical protein